MNLHNIDGVNIPFDNSWNGIAISLSGGADSALLAFLLCNIVKNQTVHIISHTRMWKTRPWQGNDSLKVFVWLTSRFPNIKFERHTNFIAPDVEYGNMGPIIKDEYGKMVSGDNAQQRAYAEYVCYYNNIDAYYNAVTRNPRGIDLGGMIERDIEPTEDNRHLEIMQHQGKWALHPFRFVDKSWIVKQYKDNNITDLFDITRSCEGEFEGINYETYTPDNFIPTCGKCFWCKEREWAIAQHNK
jgi:hypothetical protein